ncbi:hypothetical protein E0Z10_g9400 [Xylaria hypoxylon]|uniref:Uncharacterized protein n=1 Tax=Xylaria hypoxylon TaxID=37992 RepID=A0A4Z0YJ59_9PEZI|nr:hypothetical protein E0Z10_g9400 [Xylaria hypoxylon]
MRAPKSPWWSKDVEREQYWTQDLLSEWHTVPPEHLPDLQQELTPEADNDEIYRGSKYPNGAQTSSALAGPSIWLPSTADPTPLENSGIESAHIESLEEEWGPQMACGNEESDTNSAAELLEGPPGSFVLPSTTDDSDPTNEASAAAKRKEKAIERAQMERETTPLSNFDDSVKLLSRNTPDLITRTNNLPLGFSASLNAPEGEPIYNVDDLDFLRDDAFEMLLWRENIPGGNSPDQDVAARADETNDREDLFNSGVFDFNTYSLEAGIEETIDPGHMDW